ncbi:hypothetical protein K491DRAFT_57052 [Lophiostoma macrostomum CBS 122681]|uniref:Uncharacterized protein n=1 Tax=Lophiostoma macrostomum CBS 122681 TaxID=1314788 RepID=A0A6A6SZ14_9PLEO|nr:hypothetical protein K491DRAFT_57052 [Lophiostoma macrostomum CBS 122681]
MMPTQYMRLEHGVRLGRVRRAPRNVIAPSSRPRIRAQTPQKTKEAPLVIRAALLARWALVALQGSRTPVLPSLESPKVPCNRALDFRAVPFASGDVGIIPSNLVLHYISPTPPTSHKRSPEQPPIPSTFHLAFYNLSNIPSALRPRPRRRRAAQHDDVCGVSVSAIAPSRGIAGHG